MKSIASDALSTLELPVLLAVLRLDGTAYGVSITDEVAIARGRQVSMAAIHNAWNARKTAASSSASSERQRLSEAAGPSGSCA